MQADKYNTIAQESTGTDQDLDPWGWGSVSRQVLAKIEGKPEWAVEEN